MYKQVAKMTPVARIYEQQLLAGGTIDATRLAAMKKAIREEMEREYQKSREAEYKSEDWMTKEWASIKNVEVDPEATGITAERLHDVGARIATLPEDS